MANRTEILNLVDEKERLTKKLQALIYGTPEVREKNGKKYLYAHYREEGVTLTKYIGEYSEELYNAVIYGNTNAKLIKKQIREIDKQLKNLGYTDKEIDEKVKLNIDFARAHIVDTIYNQAVLEGIATTYADTETIIEGGRVKNMTADDILKVLNLKHAWEFILNKNVILSPINFALLCEINKFIEDGFYYSAGKLRVTPVSIGGTNWKPEFPIESVIKEQLQDILISEIGEVDKAIELLLFVMKKQIFIDGNKRTAVVFANHFLISKAKGLIVIPEGRVEEFRKLLIDYYEDKDTESIKYFLKNHAYHAI